MALELACTCIWEAVYITTWDIMDIVGPRMTHPASYCSSNGAASLLLCTKSMTCSNHKAFMYLLPQLAYTHIGGSVFHKRETMSILYTKVYI